MLVAISPPADFAPPTSPGGFRWRYADLTTAHGTGAVLIWGWALPFLNPDSKALPATLPFLNLALYENGVQSFYHLEVFDPSEVRPEGKAWHFGKNLLRSEVFYDRVELHASLNLDVAAGPQAQGSFDLVGAPATGHPGGQGAHRWSLLSTACNSGLDLRCGDLRWAMRGRGYHDENESSRALPELGILSWSWGHTQDGDAERIHYLCRAEPSRAEHVSGTTGANPENDPFANDVAMVIRAEADGRLQFSRAMPVERGRLVGPWGLSAPSALALGGEVTTLGPLVDASSFYLRYALSGPSGPGWGETVHPAAIRSRWMQQLVQTCVRRPTTRPTLLPFFTGPRATRWARLYRWWWAGAGP